MDSTKMPEQNEIFLSKGKKMFRHDIVNTQK